MITMYKYLTLCFFIVIHLSFTNLEVIPHHQVATAVKFHRNKSSIMIATVSGKIVGTLAVFLPFQCWFARFGELTETNNIGRTRRWARSEKTVLGGSAPTIFFWDFRSHSIKLTGYYNVIYFPFIIHSDSKYDSKAFSLCGKKYHHPVDYCKHEFWDIILAVRLSLQNYLTFFCFAFLSTLILLSDSTTSSSELSCGLFIEGISLKQVTRNLINCEFNFPI